MRTHSISFSGALRTAVIAGLLCAAAGYTTTVSAAQGCGYGLHRGAFGGCVLNRPGPGATPAPYHPGCWRNYWGNLRCYR